MNQQPKTVYPQCCLQKNPKFKTQLPTLNYDVINRPDDFLNSDCHLVIESYFDIVIFSLSCFSLSFMNVKILSVPLPEFAAGLNLRHCATLPMNNMAKKCNFGSGHYCSATLGKF